MAGVEVATVGAGLACCCAVAGVLAYRQRQQQQSTYSALGMRDFNEEEEEEEDEDFEDDRADEEEDDFLQVESELDAQQQAATEAGRRQLLFQMDDGVEGGSSTPASGEATAAATPGPPSVSLSATSASWVDEMNAELADFDNVIGNLRRHSDAPPAGAVWSQTLVDAELATPPAATR